MKIDIGRILENRKIMAALSLLIAIIMWFGVVLSVDTEGQRTIANVPVQIDSSKSTVGRLDIRPLILEDAPLLVSVTVSGKRSVIGNISAEDIFVTAPINNIMAAGAYNLAFAATDLYGKGFGIVSINPAVQNVRFDLWVPRTMEVTFPKGGLTIPEGYVMGNVITSPETVELSGPDSIISQLTDCVVSYSFDGPLTSTFDDTLPLVFMGTNSSQMLLSSSFVTIKDSSGRDISMPGEVHVTIPVLKRKVLPVSVGFSHVPTGFDLSSLEYELSESELALAGPEASIDLRNDFPLGHIDMRDLEPGYERNMPVTISSGYMNLYDIETIRVSFPLNGYETREFTISNIDVINEQKGYNVSVVTRQMKVRVVGPADTLKTLTAADFLAEIDMDSIGAVSGQITVPLTIKGINLEDVWAVGRYSAVVTVRES